MTNITLTTNKGEGNKIAIPVLTPDRAEKRQNGRRFKDDGEPMFTLTSQDRHGVAVEPIGKEVSNTLDTSCNQGIFVQVSEELTVYAVWYEKYQCYIAIRKLTPRECFRLQGWSDDYFEKAQFVNSDSQLYKQLARYQFRFTFIFLAIASITVTVTPFPACLYNWLSEFTNCAFSK